MLASSIPAPQPARLRILRGNPGKRRIREEVQPTLIEEIPPPPDYLTDVAKKEWERISAELVRLRLLTTVDIHTLGAYCAAYARWVDAETQLAASDLTIETANGTVVQNPLVAIARNTALHMVRYATEFGLTPSARARLAAGPEQKKGKFEGLVSAAG